MNFVYRTESLLLEYTYSPSQNNNLVKICCYLQEGQEKKLVAIVNKNHEIHTEVNDLNCSLLEKAFGSLVRFKIHVLEPLQIDSASKSEIIKEISALEDALVERILESMF